MKNLIVCFLFFLVFSSFSFGLYKVPSPNPLPTKEVRFDSYLKDSGSLVAEETLTFQKQETKKGSFLVLNSKIKTKDKDGKYFYSTNQANYLIEDGALSSASQTTKIDKESASYQDLSLKFDWAKNKAVFSKKDYVANENSSKTIKLTPKTMTARGSTFYLQHMIANKIKKDQIKMIVPNGATYDMNVSINFSPKVLKVSGKMISCYKVSMKPNIGFLSMALPEMTFWFAEEAPYSFIRYEGLERGPGSPEIIQEIVNL
ncbi:hypothetical protein A3J90_05485 [candidate division WOR-1 bacterium RIFOXYC2_FULL_37_10]|nr:MAG: hypothetical protein A3J90_05485 [candidate division WOR-1 bacterium RIFOXYC2_FULL_37_10]